MRRRPNYKTKTNIQFQILNTSTVSKISKICFSVANILKNQSNQKTNRRKFLPRVLSGIQLPTVKTTSSREQDSSLPGTIFSLTCGEQQTSTMQKSLRQPSENPQLSQERPFFTATCTTSTLTVEFLELSSSLRATSLSILGQREAMVPWMSSCAAMLSH